MQIFDCIECARSPEVTYQSALDLLPGRTTIQNIKDCAPSFSSEIDSIQKRLDGAGLNSKGIYFDLRSQFEFFCGEFLRTNQSKRALLEKDTLRFLDFQRATGRALKAKLGIEDTKSRTFSTKLAQAIGGDYFRPLGPGQGSNIVVWADHLKKNSFLEAMEKMKPEYNFYFPINPGKKAEFIKL